jgi:hypothetical protein
MLIRYTVMRTTLTAGALLLAFSTTLLVQTRSPLAASVEDAMRAFWDAGSPSEAEKRVATVVATRATFDEVLPRLRAGRPYAAERTGRVDACSSWTTWRRCRPTTHRPRDGRCV